MKHIFANTCLHLFSKQKSCNQHLNAMASAVVNGKSEDDDTHFKVLQNVWQTVYFFSFLQQITDRHTAEELNRYNEQFLCGGKLSTSSTKPVRRGCIVPLYACGHHSEIYFDIIFQHKKSNFHTGIWAHNKRCIGTKMQICYLLKNEKVTIFKKQRNFPIISPLNNGFWELYFTNQDISNHDSITLWKCHQFWNNTPPPMSSGHPYPWYQI
jgi:hypothetical protein